MEGSFYIFKGRMWRYNGNAIFVQGEVIKMANGNEYAIDTIHYDSDNHITYYHLVLLSYSNEYGSYALRMKGDERSEVFTRKKHYTKERFADWYNSKYGAEQEGLY
jgi:hypothetical protein